MSEEFEQAQGEFPLRPIGERLKRAREAAGLSLEQVSAETRISTRHLEMIEQGRFSALPARTYAIGFSRTYARQVGFDEKEAVAEVRAALDASDDSRARRNVSAFEPGDPARIPSARLGWVAALLALLALGGAFFFYRSFFAPGATLPALNAPAPEPSAAKPRVAPPAGSPVPVIASGPVIFTAMEDGLWIKFYDATGKSLLQKRMAKDESFAVPADAQGPLVWTGRPDAFAITVGGRPVPRLADQQGIMKDVPVTAQALLARRPQAAIAPAGSEEGGAVAPANRASPTD